MTEVLEALRTVSTATHQEDRMLRHWSFPERRSEPVADGAGKAPSVRLQNLSPTMKVLVFAHEQDNHVAPIRWALQQAGYHSVCWSGVSWEETEQASLFLGESSRVVLGKQVLEAGDVVWLRQPDQPEFGPQPSGPGETPPGSRYVSFFESVAALIEAQPVRCVNRLSASRLVRNKAVQLQIARACGLRVPATLMSNSPGAAKEFFERSWPKIVCKPFASHIWQREAGGAAVTGTFELRREDLPADEVFTYAPAIFQQMIDKRFDVRTVLMGKAIYSFALHTPSQALDWRQPAGLGQLRVEAIATPADVERGVLEFARRSGVCFGSLDFAVDANGAWWFLEINEQGQFLWIDQFHPQARLQQKFCAFLTAPEASTQPLEEREHLFRPLLDYEESPEKREADRILSAVLSESRYSSREL